MIDKRFAQAIRETANASMDYYIQVDKPTLIEMLDFIEKNERTADIIEKLNEKITYLVEEHKKDKKYIVELEKNVKEQEREIYCLKEHVHISKCKNCGKEFEHKRGDAIYCRECSLKNAAKKYHENLSEEERAIKRERHKLYMREYKKKKREGKEGK